MEPLVALEWYFRLADVVSQHVKMKRSLSIETLGHPLKKEKITVYQEILNELNHCTIFQIDWKSMAEVRKSGPLFSETEDEARRSVEAIFTLPHPASVMFVGFKGAEYIGPVKTNPTRVVGMFLSPKTILTINETFITHKEVKQYTVISLLEDGQWTYSRRRRHALEIRINLLKMAIQVINECHTVTVALDTKEPTFKTFNKKEVVANPETYHIVTLQKKVRYVSSEQHSVETTEDSEQRKKKQTHYARGHPAVRVNKETLPADPKRLKVLRKDERRKIFLNRSEIDEDAWRTLNEREITVGEHEWVAILEYWIGETKSKPGKALIPSIYVQKSEE